MSPAAWALAETGGLWYSADIPPRPVPPGVSSHVRTMFQPRVYRNQAGSDDLVSFRVCVAETDLLVSAESDQAARGFAIVRALREDIEQEIGLDRRFLTSLEPLTTRRACPPVVRAMYEAAQQAGVGPMAAVAGAVAESVARALQPHSAQIVVENGGDIYIISKVSRVIGIQAGRSPLSGKVGLQVPAGSLGVCTSSGTVGHSLSFGRADAALIAADDGALADAFASALGNRVQSAADVPAAMEWAQTAPGVRQALVIVGETMGVWGEFELTAVGPP